MDWGSEFSAKSRWIAAPQFIIWNVFGHDRSGTNHSTFTYGDTGQQRGIGTDGSTAMDGRDGVSIRALERTWVSIIGERDIWADKNLICDAEAVPELHAAFDRDLVADSHIVFNEHMGADVAVRTDLRIWQNDAKLPDTGSFADVRRLDVGEGMDEGRHGVRVKK